MLGGGFGLASYVGQWRDTKDIDFYILPESRDPLAEALAKAGFTDYYEQLSYDRGWIYRCARQGVIIDLIWSMANRRAQVDESWFEHAESIAVRDEIFQVIPAEELLWCKLYVLQMDRCDWPDVFKLLHAVGPSLNWDRLLKRLGGDVALLKSAMTVFDWLCPTRAAEVPAKIRQYFRLPKSVRVSPQDEQRRLHLIDSRAWFPFPPRHVPMEV
jgi:hypothetical protein